MDYKEEKIIGGDGHVAIHDWAPVDSNGHHKNSDDIENDINETRHTMDVIFDTLADRFHPRTIVDRLLDRYQIPENRKKVQDYFLKTGKRVSETFQENPVPMVLIGIGAAWLLLEKRTPYVSYQKEKPQDRFRDKAEETGGRVSQAVRERFESVKESASGIKESVSAGVQNAKESIQAKSDQVKERLAESKEKGYDIQRETAERYGQTGSSVSNVIKERPLAVGIAAAMFGLAAGILFPETRAERKTVGTPAKEAVEAIRERGEDVAERAKEVVNETKTTAYQKADEKKIIPESIKKSEEKPVEDATRNVASEMRDTKYEENKVTPGIGNVPKELKEKLNEKRNREDNPDKPKV